MPRYVGAIPASWFDDDNIVYWYFIRQTWPGPVGTLRWTTHPADQFIADINIGDSVQTWEGNHVWTPGQFEQGEQNSLSISDITFGNADFSYTDIMNQFSYGVRGIPMEVFAAAFTKTTPHTFIDRIYLFGGRGDRSEVTENEVRVSLLAFSVPLIVKYPARRFTPAYGFNWIPVDNLKIKMGTTQVALPTRGSTTPGGGTGGGGGGGGGGTPGPFVPTPRMPVIPVESPRPKPRNRGGNKPRTVTR